MTDTYMLPQTSCTPGDTRPAGRFRRALASGIVVVIVAVVIASVGACRPADVLSVPAPAGVADPSSFQNGGGAAALRVGALDVFSTAVGGFNGLVSTESIVQDGALFGDELTEGDVDAWQMPLDNRTLNFSTGFLTAPGAFVTDRTYGALQKARITALDAALALKRYGGPSARSQVAEMFAVAGYAELFLAESFCAGVPLGQLGAGEGVVHGVPLTTDSVFATAALAFDSALAYASDSTQYLARIGLARALVGRGQFAAAKAAVAGVPTAFVYVTTRPAYSGSYSGNGSLWSWLVAPAGVSGSRFASVADHKGGNGMPYVSAQDPRMPIDSGQGQTEIGTTLYYPLKFPLGTATAIPLADGLEARLVEAEAALQTNDILGWTTALNALRADTANTHIAGLGPLTADSTTTASSAERVDVMFRERAFWLYGTGRRLGDLRRLIRQYGRDQAAVFPTGPYPLHGNPAIIVVAPQTYGSDVTFPVQAAEAANPNFHGCLSRGA